jgi:cytochrome P450
MVGEVLGFEARLHGELRRWADDIVGISPVPRSDEDAARIRASVRELTGLLGEIVEDRQRAPGSDMVTDLVEAQVNGQSLTKDEIVDFLVLLLLGGLETTMHLLSNSMHLLSRRPDLFDTVRADPSCVGSFIEEMLRYEGVAPMLPRLTTQDVELQGVKIPAGELVAALLASANRDERVFKNADQFDLKRGSTGGIAFGAGHHFCIGASLARMEARVMLTSLFERVKRIEPCEEKVEYNCAFTTRGPVALRLRFTPA